MTDKSSARPVEVAPFEPPTPDNQPNQNKSKNNWPYVVAAVLLLVAVPATFKVVRLLGTTADPQVVLTPEASAVGEFLDEGFIAPTDSPFEDALLVEARASSQEILSELLPLRRSLEERRVDQWAEQTFSRLVALAVEGDELYRARDFEQSQMRYRESLALAQEIDQQAASVAEDLRREGYAAIDDRNAQLAQSIFELAVEIEEDDESGQKGLLRALALPEVEILLAAAESYWQQSQLEEAKSQIEEALSLDLDDPRSQEMLASIEADILRRDFQEAMSIGFRELSTGNYEQAQLAFRSARNLDPENPAVVDALDQVEATRESDRSGALLQQARIAEKSEQWSLALERYQQLLQEDPNRVEARIALVKVEARSTLETQMLHHIENPLPLRDDRIWSEAEDTLEQARSINNPGPLLADQIRQLSQTLRKARTPVRLELVSDGNTQISVLGVSNLGTIRNHPLDLNPGKYVVIGKKSGYQDVRQDVILTGDEPRVIISVIPDRSLESL